MTQIIEISVKKMLNFATLRVNFDNLEVQKLVFRTISKLFRSCLESVQFFQDSYCLLLGSIFRSKGLSPNVKLFFGVPQKPYLTLTTLPPGFLFTWWMEGCKRFFVPQNLFIPITYTANLYNAYIINNTPLTSQEIASFVKKVTE